MPTSDATPYRRAAALAALAATALLLSRIPDPATTDAPDPCRVLPAPGAAYDYVPTPPHGGIFHDARTGDVYGYALSEDSPIYPDPTCSTEDN